MWVQRACKTPVPVGRLGPKRMGRGLKSEEYVNVGIVSNSLKNLQESGGG